MNISNYKKQELKLRKREMQRKFAKLIKSGIPYFEWRRKKYKGLPAFVLEYIEFTYVPEHNRYMLTISENIFLAIEYLEGIEDDIS